MKSIHADHDLRRFYDGIGDVADLEVKILDRLAGDNCSYDIAVPQIKFYPRGNQSLFDQRDLSLQFVAGT